MTSRKTLLAHVTADKNFIIERRDVFACSLLHRELRNMCVYIPVEIQLVVFSYNIAASESYRFVSKRLQTN